MPQKPIISNNTPLSALAAIGHFSLLGQVFGRILIPQAVKDEFLAIDRQNRTRLLASADWLDVQTIANPRLARSFSDLDEGEAEVLALALEQPPRLVIIDERRGRAYAKRLGLPLTGTVGVLLRAKQKALVPAISPLLDTLLQTDFHLHPSVIDKALELAGE